MWRVAERGCVLDWMNQSQLLTNERLGSMDDVNIMDEIPFHTTHPALSKAYRDLHQTLQVCNGGCVVLFDLFGLLFDMDTMNSNWNRNH